MNDRKEETTNKEEAAGSGGGGANVVAVRSSVKRISILKAKPGLKPLQEAVEVVRKINETKLTAVQKFQKAATSFVDLAAYYLNVDNLWPFLRPELKGDTKSQRFESLLKQCVHEHDDAENYPLFYYVERNDLTRIKMHLEFLVDNSPDATAAKNAEIREISKRDAVGGSVIHFAYIKKRYNIARFLVQKYPKLALMVFQGRDEDGGTTLSNGEKISEEDMPYNGQNILHLTIVDHNIVEARWLLDFYRNRSVAALFEPEYFKYFNYTSDEKNSRYNHYETGLVRLLTACAKGSFFSPDGPYYFGEFPLFFALCSGNIEMFDLLMGVASNLYVDVAKEEIDIALNYSDKGMKKHAFKVHTYAKQSLGPNAIFLRDTYGNNILHLCVIHGLDAMYNHCLKLAHQTLVRQVKKSYAYKSKSHLRPGDFYILPLTDFTMGRLDGGLGFGYAPLEKMVRMPTPNRYDAWLSAVVTRKLEERLILCLNEDLHSSLTMCAAIRPHDDLAKQSKRKTMEFLLRGLRIPRWSYGPVNVSLLDLEGVETNYRRQNYIPRISPSRDMYSCIEWLCITQGDDSLTITEIKDIVELKWDRVGFRKFFGRLLEHVILTLSLTVLVCLMNANAYYDRNPIKPADWALSFMYPCNAAQMLVMFLWDTRNALRFRFKRDGISGKVSLLYEEHKNNPLWLIVLLLHFFCVEVVYDFVVAGTRGAAKFNRLSRLLTVLSFFLHCVFDYTEQTSWYGIQQTAINVKYPDEYNNVTDYAFTYSNDEGLYYKPINDLPIQLPMVVCIISCYLRMFYFLMGFTNTGPFVLAITKIISHDLVFISAFYIVTIMAFACGLSLLVSNGDPNGGFFNLVVTFWVLFKNTVGNGSITWNVSESNVASNDIELFDFIYTMFTLTLNIMFLNLLIALINTTYATYTNLSDGLLVMERYNMLCLMDLPLTEGERVTELMAFGVCPSDMADQHFASLRESIQLNMAGQLHQNRYDDDDEDYDKTTQKAAFITANENEGEVKMVTSTPSSPKTNHHTNDNESSHPVVVSTTSGPGQGPSSLLQKARNETNTAIQTGVVAPTQRAILKTLAWCLGLEDESSNASSLPHIYYEVNEVNKEWFRGGTSNVSSQQSNNHGSQLLSKKKIALLLIDPQNCFHPEGGVQGTSSYHSQGSLAVPGANEDAARVARMIIEHLDDIDEIFITLDTHYRLHIAHACSWRRGIAGMVGDVTYAVGDNPLPFTRITHSDVDAGLWLPTRHLSLEWVKFYSRSLENNNTFELTIWPDHGIIGSAGHAVVPELNRAIHMWARHRQKNIQYLKKGMNLRTECFSALRCEVEDPLDAKNTSLNRKFLFALDACDTILVSGQALSHSVNFTMKDLVIHLSTPTKLYLLKDGCSSVQGFEGASDDFVDDMFHAGVHLTATNKVFPLMRDHCRKTKPDNNTTTNANAHDSGGMRATASMPTQADESVSSPAGHGKKRNGRSSFDGVGATGTGGKGGGDGGGVANPHVLADLIAKNVYEMMKQGDRV